MQARSFQVRSLSWLSSILLLVVLVLVNVVFARSTTRVDLTEEGLYTLSDGSRSILGRLEDPASIKVFWADVPARFDHTKRYVAALLGEMEDASNGLVQSTWVDLSDDSGKDEASELGVQHFLFSAAHGKEVRQSKGYMSLVIEMGEEKPLILNALFQIENQLEYQIVQTVYQRSRVTRRVIGFVSNRPFNPFGGGRQPSPFSRFEGMLQQAFGSGARTYLDLASPVPEDVDVLIVARPRNLTAEQVYRFEQFLLRGGRGILLEDPADIENVFGRAAQQAEPHTSGFEDWLAHLGLTIERGAVADFRFPSDLVRGGRELVGYPYWPRVQREFMELENPVMRNTPPMSLYWPGALSVDRAKQEGAGRTATVLATSSNGGYRRGDLTGLGSAEETYEGKLLEEVPLIVLFEGPMTSFWLGKPIPGTEAPEADDTPVMPGIGPIGPPGVEPGAEEPAKDEPKKDEPKKGEATGSPDGDGDEEADAEEDEGPARLERGEIRLLVLADADFLEDRLMDAWVTRARNGSVAADFVLSAADWLSGSDELLALRARATNPRNLDEIEESDQEVIKHVNLWAVPLLIILAGLTMFFVRRSG